MIVTDYVIREKTISQKTFVLRIVDALIQATLLMAAFLMLTGFLYLIR
ncbi:MAG TPA: hypothetical protein VF941_11865 [Clostridia bacterium]